MEKMRKVEERKYERKSKMVKVNTKCNFSVQNYCIIVI